MSNDKQFKLQSFFSIIVNVVSEFLWQEIQIVCAMVIAQVQLFVFLSQDVLRLTSRLAVRKNNAV